MMSRQVTSHKIISENLNSLIHSMTFTFLVLSIGNKAHVMMTTRFAGKEVRRWSSGVHLLNSADGWKDGCTPFGYCWAFLIWQMCFMGCLRCKEFSLCNLPWWTMVCCVVRRSPARDESGKWARVCLCSVGTTACILCPQDKCPSCSTHSSPYLRRGRGLVFADLSAAGNLR